MEKLYELQVGNFINHRSGLGIHDFAQIETIEELEGRIVYQLQHRRQPEGFVGYDDQLGDIIMRPEHIEALGFTRNATTGFYELMQHTISYQGYTRTENGRLVQLSAHMRIFRPFTPVPQNPQQPLTVEDFERYTVPVNLVHMFQNYCTANGIMLDFSPLTQFQNEF